MMRIAMPWALAAALVLTGLTGGLMAAQVEPAGATAKAAGPPAGRAGGRTPSRFGRYTIESKHLEGTIGGPWEFSKGVTIVGPEVMVTCDRLQVWPGKTGRDLERAEASGHVVVHARYVAGDKTEWKVMGTASAGSYDGKLGQGVLRGGVRFDGTNLSTGAVLSVVADKLIYDVKSRQFRFERGSDPVRLQWEEPEPAQAGKAASGPAPKEAGK